MRFDIQAFTASLRPISAEESRANMAALVAAGGQSERHVSVELDVKDDLNELDLTALVGNQQRVQSA